MARRIFISLRQITQTCLHPSQSVINVTGCNRILCVKFQFASSVRSFVPAQKKIKNIKMANRQSGDGILEFGDTQVFAWSISGLETCVVVKNPAYAVCFDLGIAHRRSVSCEHVFISHGHMDHIAALPQHVSKRNLLGMGQANYYVPEHLTSLVQDVCRNFCQIHESNDALNKVNIIPAKIDEEIKIHRGVTVVPFRTFHRVRSQGYILYRNIKRLKQEYKHLQHQEIGAKIREGVDVHDHFSVPEVAYTGDTTFELFESSPPADLLKVKLLVVEATYIDDEEGKDKVGQARERGHIHLSELVKREELFENVENILLIHFSDKYSSGYIRETVYKTLPESLKTKVVVATFAKENS